jgi:GT2 family glycosyltransferase
MANDDGPQRGLLPTRMLGLTVAMNVPRIAIIILNWNGWRDTLECLESVQRLDYPDYRIIVVDNRSTDDSIAKIRSWCRGEIAVRTRYVEHAAEKKPLELIEYDSSTGWLGREHEAQKDDHDVPSFGRLVLLHSEKNLGFAGGNNIAIKYALEKGYDYIWFLNNDAVPDRKALTHLLLSAESDGRIGMVGSRIFDYAEPDKVQSIGENTVLTRMRGKWPFLQKPCINPDQGDPRPLWMWAASLLIRRACLEEIRGFDERYFFCGEDIDLCIRANKRHWELSCCMNSYVWHKGALKDAPVYKTFFGKKVRLNTFSRFELRGYYEIRNEIFFFKKNVPQLLALSLLLDLGLLIKILAVEDDKIARIRVVLNACWDGLADRMGEKRRG